jgi:hypothetical protein
MRMGEQVVDRLVQRVGDVVHLRHQVPDRTELMGLQHRLQQSLGAGIGDDDQLFADGDRLAARRASRPSALPRACTISTTRAPVRMTTPALAASLANCRVAKPWSPTPSLGQ